MNRVPLPFFFVWAALSFLLSADGRLEQAGDSPRFVMLARSLASGDGYISRFDLVDRPETQVAFAYPILLAAVVRLAGPEAWLTFELFSALAMLVAIGGAWWWVREWRGREDADRVAAVMCVLASVQFYATTIATEPLFMAAVFLAMALAERIARSSRLEWMEAAGFSLLVAFAFHLRVAGIALLIVLVAFLVVRRRWRDATMLGTVALAGCSPWLLWLATHGFGYSEEFEQASPGVAALVLRVFYNLAADLAKALPDLFAYPFLSAYLPWEPMFFVKGAVGVALVAGGIIGVRTGVVPSGPTGWFLLLYGVGALGWTVHGDRYLLPLLPVLIALICRTAPLTTAVLVVGLAGSIAGILAVQTMAQPPDQAGFAEAVSWLNAHSSPSDRVMSRHPAWVAAVTGRRGIRFESTEDPEAHRDTLSTTNIRWLIVDRQKIFRDTGEEFLAPLLSRYPANLALRYTASPEGSGVRVYEVLGW